MGPAKLKKAEDLVIKIISETEFLAIICNQIEEKKEEGQGILL